MKPFPPLSNFGTEKYTWSETLPNTDICNGGECKSSEQSTRLEKLSRRIWWWRIVKIKFGEFFLKDIFKNQIWGILQSNFQKFYQFFKMDLSSSQPGWSSCPHEDEKIHLEAREIRTNSWWAGQIWTNSKTKTKTKTKTKREIRTNSWWELDKPARLPISISLVLLSDYQVFVKLK